MPNYKGSQKRAKCHFPHEMPWKQENNQKDIDCAGNYKCKLKMGFFKTKRCKSGTHKKGNRCISNVKRERERE
jgi:hypothetical protein